MSGIFGETLRVEQENGPPLELVVWGDEFYVRHETKDGFTVTYDTALGLYCYAEVQDGHLVSTGASTAKRPPVGLRRHLQESSEVQKARFDARFNHLRPQEHLPMSADDTFFTLGPNNGLLAGRRVSQGEILGLTILVEFSDVAATVSADDVDALLNADNYSRNGNFCSAREYFQIVSNGNLNYSNRVVGPIKLPNTKKHYETTSMVPEAFSRAMTVLTDDGVDLGLFDSKGEGILDAVNFMYAGSTVYGVNGNNNNPSELWPHNSVRQLQHGGFRTHFYQLSSMGRQAVDLSIGTFCHESAHLLCRFPDLYDYGRRDGDLMPSRGIGSYCLMGSGNHLNRGRTPSPVCAYLRDLVGWTDTEIRLDGPGSHRARHSDYGTVMKFRTGRPNEYFLIENRCQLGLDGHLPSNGLAIYHCDINGSNELQEGSASRHYQVALLQADGRRDLELNRDSDGTDLFADRVGVALDHQSQPSARQWDGSDSGLVVSDIGAAGDEMSFRVGADVASSAGARGESIAHRLIPDNDSDGIHDGITLSERGTVSAVTVEVDITHSWIGDLRVSLLSPDGATAVLFDRTGEDGDDIRATLTPDTLPALADLAGGAVNGQWSLHVQDLEGQDIGRLNRWALDVTFDSADQTVSGEAQADAAIPDADQNGIVSSIEIDADGQLLEARVQVEIAHPYIGDLHVELVAPSGQSALLHNQSGQSNDDLRVTFDSSLAPALAVLAGQPIRGQWSLRVRDLAPDDIGRLEKWGLHLRYSNNA